jgi:hypothetical protein
MTKPVTVHFTTDLGAQVSVETTHDKVLECQRYFGARPVDPPHLREQSGDIEYITLATFRGGKRNEAYASRKDSTP